MGLCPMGATGHRSISIIKACNDQVKEDTEEMHVEMEQGLLKVTVVETLLTLGCRDTPPCRFLAL